MPNPTSTSTPVPRAVPRYALGGKIVTMDDRATVLEHGLIIIDNERIKAVQSAADPLPHEYRDIPVIQTGDTIFPGLIELHNHLSYNILPMWDVPKKYLNCKQWRSSSPPYYYQRGVTAPMKILAQTPGLLPAIVRYVECKCLVAGVTTSQGITLSSDQGIQKHYRGTIRNVESPTDEGLPAAHTKIAAIDKNGAAALRDQLEDLAGEGRCYLHHLSEGVNKTSHDEFVRLRLADGTWAINRAYAGIHSLALTADDFGVVAEHGGAMIWSPMSNLMLYGQTADIRAAKQAGVRIGLGADWSPSGSKNLLGELKVAYLVSREQGDVFDMHELVAMVTRTPAQILGWDAEIGSIEPEKRADLMIVNGQKGNPYERLLRARETSVTLVVIDGVPRCGTRRLMEVFSDGAATETIAFAGSQRMLHLHEHDADPLVAGLTLEEARESLAQAMYRLPELAVEVENQPSGYAGGSRDATGTWWTLALDMDEHLDGDDLDGEDLDGGADGDARSPASALSMNQPDGFARAALPPLPELVESMDLDALTTAEDSSFFRTLAIQRNVPEYIKDGLPPLYGKEPWNPDSVGYVKECHAVIRDQLAHATNLHTFLRTSGQLKPGDREHIVQTAIQLMEHHYVHLPLKQAMYGINPVQRLRLLLYQLKELPAEQLPSEIEFHKEMLRIFNSTRDLHTRYILPYPYRDKIACLPFLLEECWEAGEARYIVSKLLLDSAASDFRAGVELLYWNGVPIAQAVARNADRLAGGNRAARHARGLGSMTIRPLAYVLPPEDEWVALRYRTEDGSEAEITQEWLVFRSLGTKLGFDTELDLIGRDLTAGDVPAVDLSAFMALGMDQQTETIHQTQKLLFAPHAVVAEGRATGGDEVAIEDDDALATRYPGIIRAKILDTGAGPIGYIRIFSFNVRDPDAFVHECARLVDRLPEDGLILDLRGNGGGLIYAAERLLQLFTPRRIEPQRAQFINSPLNLDLCARHSPSALDSRLDLEPWEASIRQSVTTGATYSRAFWITSPESCNAIGQRYYGPVLLITDALCYSAADIFAAGFQDHDIGVILGTHVNTGAGGANMWTHAQLHKLMAPSAQDAPAGSLGVYEPLPHGAGMSVAIRRTLRVGPQSGNLLEDLGVAPHVVHHMTRDDVLHGNRDLIADATRILRDKKAHPLRVKVRKQAGEPVCLDIETRNIDRVDVSVNEVPLGFVDTRSDGGSFVLRHHDLGADTQIELRGWEDQHLVAYRREHLPRGQ